MDITRRDFVKSSLAIAAVSRLPLGAAAPGIKKGLVFDMVSDKLSYGDRFRLVRDAGFEVVQALTEPDRGKAEEMKRAADAANLRIDSVMNVDHWQYPLSSSDPAVVEKSLSGMRMSLQNAKLCGADAVLLVPAVVNPQTSYRDGWTRSQAQTRKLLPLADQASGGSAIDEAWNKSLASPVELASS